jgi:hypothetical protein
VRLKEAQSLDQGCPGEIGQCQLDEHETEAGGQPLNEFQRGSSRGGLDRLVSAGLQSSPERPASVGLVLDDQDEISHQCSPLKRPAKSRSKTP